MTIQKDAQRLTMSRRVQKLMSESPGTSMETLFLDFNSQHFHTLSTIRALLVPSRDAPDAIKTPNWHSVRRFPGPVSRWENGDEHVKYHRFGNDDGLEPLLLVREFHDLKEPYVEVSEEFRLFHNLYHEQEHQRYIKIDDAGQETVVVELRADCVSFRILEVRQYLAIREMHLLVQFDIQERSRYSLAELSLANEEKANHDKHSNWRLYFTELDREDHIAFARLIGKRLVPPVEKRHSGFPGFSAEVKRYVDFVIGQDNQGGEVRATCDPAKLPQYSAEVPDFFTPVSFRKSVLDRYYSQPSKFMVSDGTLSCGNLWMLEFDDDHEDRVCVWQGDLGKILPYREQQHWQAHNFVPNESHVSKTFFERQFEGKFAESRRPEHEFRAHYLRLADTCEQRLGWQILQPLHDKDAHRLAAVRVPASGEQPPFDEQVQGLATILVDSLNVGHISKLVPKAEQLGQGRGIDLLEALFRTGGIQDFNDHIDFLRTVQRLRSAGSAHRKGRKYDKLADKVRLVELGPQRVAANLIGQANDFLCFMADFVDRGVKSKGSEGRLS